MPNLVGALITLGSLNQGASAVTNADKSYTNFRH